MKQYTFTLTIRQFFKEKQDGGVPMALPERSFYKLSELAKRWGIDEDTLLDWGKQGRIKFWFYYQGSAINKDLTISKYGLDAFHSSRTEIELSRKYCRDFCGPIKLSILNITDSIFSKRIELHFVVMNNGSEWIFSERLDEDGLYKFSKVILSASDFIVLKKEVLRMEANHQELSEHVIKITAQATDQETGYSQETKLTDQSKEAEEAMVKQLRQEGMADKAIAQELKKNFPQIYPSRIGRLITEDGSIVTTEAFRKRGERLLK